MPFSPVSPKPNFPKIEEKILKFWEENKIFKRSVEKNKGKKRFVFYEGPPTANGKPHIGHVLARAFKDFFPRYKTMKGFLAERKGGWDTHGLPVELEVEKELKISGKPEIEKYGIEKFNQKCKTSVFRYVDDWEKMSRRIGFWIDMEKPYITLSNDYIESLWWILKKIWDKKLLVQGYKSLPYCFRCGTSLSSHEVAQGYEDVKDPSIFIKFPLSQEKNTYFLVWTTTPWTLPGNMLLAVNPDAFYLKVRVSSGEKLYLAKERVEVLKQEYEVVSEVRGTTLEDLEYVPLFEFIRPTKRAYYTVPANFVSLEDGTGIVHIAPAFGEDDLNLGKKLDLDFIQPVDLEGKFIKEVIPWKGINVKEADPKIIEDLKERNLLFREESIFHSYPFCWRCHNPLLYYAMSSWFIKTTAVKKHLIKNNRSVSWYPSHIKEGRMGNWLETLVDWAVSRSRFWGAPIPIWECSQCEKKICLESFSDLKKRAVNPDLIDENFDPHRPFIDKIKLKCTCGGEMNRIPEVLDVWFESGAMPSAQWHFPFEGRKEFKEHFPADYICEAIDQTRGWFFSLLAVNTILFGKSPFKNCISPSHVVDIKGKKMSKHIGNVLDPWVVLNSEGADALRWYFYNSVTMGNEYRTSPELVSGVIRRFFLILWNIYKFFVTYASLDKWNIEDRSSGVQEFRSILDRWVISRLNSVIGEVTEKLDSFDPTKASEMIEDFVINDLSGWYIRRIRGRVGPTVESSEDKEAVHQTLYMVLLSLAKILAPFTPFLAEEIYQNLESRIQNPESKSEFPESVHLCDYPVVDKKLIDKDLEEKMKLIRTIIEIGFSTRKKQGLKVRQPLKTARCKVKNAKQLENEELIKLVRDELNVKEVVLEEGKKREPVVELNLSIDENLRLEGVIREVIREVQDIRKKEDLLYSDKIKLYFWAEGEIKKAIDDHREYFQSQVLADSLILDEGAKEEENKRKIYSKEAFFRIERI